jgi:hypothetical protein
MELMMNNEPVAWIDFIEESNVYDLNVSGRGTPLYFEHKPQVVRAPTYRTLTDEEIWELADMVLKNSDVIGFAKAILRKAQEK